MIPLIIDCDTGRDDALALWLAVRLGRNLIGVTTSFGNTTLQNVTDNTSGVLSFVEADSIPLFKGAEAPLRPHKGYDEVVLPRQKISGNGLCNIYLPTTRKQHQNFTPIEDFVEFIKNVVHEQGPLDYVILGPATNFAKLCLYMGSDISKVIRSVTMLGGKIGELWNQYPSADFNVVSDPEAVSVILNTPDLVKKFITLESTWDIFLTLDEICALKPKSSLGQQAKDIMETHCRVFAPEPIFRFHDPSVMLLYCFAPYIEKKIEINLAESHADYGRITCSETGGQSVLVCDYSNLDRARLLQDMLTALDIERP